MAGAIGRVLVRARDSVVADQPVVIVEAMKTEMAVVSTAAGVVADVRCTPGEMVRAGQALLVLQP